MSTFFSILFLFFLAAIAVLGYIFLKVYNTMRRIRRTFRGEDTHASRRKDRVSGTRRSNRRSRRSHRILPPEYAEDVAYEVMPRDGFERFIIVSEVLAFRGESQVSDVEYILIIEQ